MKPGTLYVVATPIGNLEDITYRAVRILGEVSLIAAEDTRHTRCLLQRYGIATSTTSFFEQNERVKVEGLIERLLKGEDIALVSDAGTPGIADPGYRLIRRALDAKVPVVPIPGPSALMAAVSVAGLPVHAFYYAGFCSPKASRRRRRLETLRDLEDTLVFFEAPHRLVAFLRDACEILGNRPAVVAREITKIHEEFRRGTLEEHRLYFERHPPRGEFTILIAGRPANRREAMCPTFGIGPQEDGTSSDGVGKPLGHPS